MKKTFKVCDDEIMMDIFRFFIERDLMYEATLLAEKELTSNFQEEGEVKDNYDANEGNEDTEVIDKMVEDDIESQTQSRLSKAEMFYLGCTLKNPKDIWNEFTFVDNSNFDFSKVNTLLNQKSKNCFVFEKRNGNTITCFGLIFTEDTAFKNWLNHETNALHLSAHMFFERQEVKQKLMVVLQEFAYKSGANKKVLKLVEIFR